MLNTTEQPKKTRLELLQERYVTLPSGPLRTRIGREIEIERGQWDGFRAKRAVKADAQIPVVRAAVDRTRRLTRATGLPPPIIPEDNRVVSNRKVQDPSMSDAEFIHQKAKKPHDPDVGKVWSQENAVTRIGALAFVRRRLSHHERAAEWFKSAYEQLYGGMAPAIDMSRIRVDTSIMFHDDAAVARVYNGWAMRDTIDRMGDVFADRVVACVVLCIPCADFARVGPSGKPSGHAIEEEVDRLLAALDKVCELRGFKTKA